MTPDRRRFLALGASAGVAAALGSLASAAQPPSAISTATPTPAPSTCLPAACELPTKAKPVPWVRPPTTVTAARRAIPDLTPAEVTRLRAAYAKMRALPPTDGRSLAAQRNLHAWYCVTCAGVPGQDIHFHWSFLPWHRMFLYFHERILGGLVNDFSLRLPYWDWETRPQLPAAYGDPANNPLYDKNRYLRSGQTVERMLTNFNTGKQRFYELSLVRRLLDCTFDDFGGSATAGGVVEAGSHGFVHVAAGGDATRYDRLPCSGDMAILNTAAYDPIFYTHHGNLDRLWHSWETHGGNADPDDAAYLDQKWAFFDERGRWVEMAVHQIGDMTKTLGVTYERAIAPQAALVGRRTGAMQRIDLLHAARGLTATNPASLAAAHAGELRLGGVHLPGSGDFRLVVKSRGVTHALTDLFVVPHDGGRMRMDATFNVCTPLWGDNVSPPNANPQLVAALLDANKTFAVEPSGPALERAPAGGRPNGGRAAAAPANAPAPESTIRPTHAELTVG